MDNMMITSKFTTNIISRIVNSLIRKKVDYEIKLHLNETNAKIVDDKIMVHLDVDVELEKGELLKMLKNIGI